MRFSDDNAENHGMLLLVRALWVSSDRNLSKNGMPWKVLGEAQKLQEGTSESSPRERRGDLSIPGPAPPVQWSLAADSSQLTLHSPHLTQENQALGFFILVLGPDWSTHTPFAPMNVAKKERYSDEPILSPMPTFLSGE